MAEWITGRRHICALGLRLVPRTRRERMARLLSSIEVEIRDSQSHSLVGIASLFRGKVRLDVPDARHRIRLKRFFDEVEFGYKGRFGENEWQEFPLEPLTPRWFEAVCKHLLPTVGYSAKLLKGNGS